MKRRYKAVCKQAMASALAGIMLVTGVPFQTGGSQVQAATTDEERSAVELVTEKITDGYRMTNGFFEVETGKYGQITSLKIVNDLYPTNYVMNTSNAPSQNTKAHQWMGELMFQSRLEGEASFVESMTSKSDSARQVELVDNKVVVTYENATETGGIKDFKVTETYYLEDEQLKWDITVENTQDKALEIGDFGVPLAFNEYWSAGDQIYETRVVDHSFVGKNSSYIYATRPSGLGQYLLMTPDSKTDAGFEYQDHWRVEERSSDEAAWCQDQSGWANGLNVFYIHSNVIQETNRGYLENTSLTLQPGESKTYGFHFSVADDETDMKSTLYEEGILDAVAVPGMTFSKDMPAKMYLHTTYAADDISVSVKCPHELGLHEGNANTVSNMLECKKNDSNTYAKYLETKMVDGEQYHIYELAFADLGQNDVAVVYDDGSKETELQFYIMDDVADALNEHSEFMVEKTQWDAEGEFYDKVFDDWMMDTKSKRGEFYGYWGWGDDWGLTHGQYIAEKNVFIPVAEEIEALDEYLDVAIWNGLMQEHQEDYLIHDFLMEEPNTTPTYRGYAYAHIYNTYYSMYKIASKYPDIVTYTEEAETYLERAYHIMEALYSDGVAYNWETGIMGELTTPDIIASLKKEGYYEEAANIEKIMSTKYDNFKNTKYPYGSEYSYDNTGEEAVYTLAKLNLSNDTDNANTMMQKIDAKTRACRGLQPVWYHYANPTTICGENWWNFQYTAALAGYCMDDYLRLQDNGLSAEQRSNAERVNYAAKLANLTCINSGQIDADSENIGTVAWTYQMEMGNLGGQGTGGGNLHNGWRQMAGEADLGLFGALQILSADVSNDPVFGLFGYGCDVEEKEGNYEVTPLDGLRTRLNLIDEQLYIELDRDQYTYALVSKDKTGLTLQMKNLEGTAHDTEINVTGLQTGAYSILVDGKETGTFKAEDGKTSSVSVPLPKANSVKVEFRAGADVKNTAPIVNAGTDKEIYLPAYEGIENATITMDVKLSGTQDNKTRLFEFGDMENHYLYVSFQNGNKVSLTATDFSTNKTTTVVTDLKVAPGYWKNFTVTIEDGNVSLFVDGEQSASIENIEFSFAKFGKVQRNYIGRSAEEAISFFKGSIDSFAFYSYAMSAEEIAEKYGNTEMGTPISAEDITLVTPVGEVAEFPTTVVTLYSTGLYREADVVWEEVAAEQYETAGKFDVQGTLVNSEIKVTAHVIVVEGTIQNLAPYAEASAIINTVTDLGGVAGLNDGYDPVSSRDTSHGVWHNWQGDQSGDAWVEYTWEEQVVITKQDAYYFTDGNFAPANVSLFYRNSKDEWIEMTGIEGLGVELNQYNTTTFDAVATTGIRMVMTPKTLGVGVIEWKVYGYSDKEMLNTKALKEAIEWAESISSEHIEEGFSQMQSLLTEAKEVLNNAEAQQTKIDETAEALCEAIAGLKPVDGNLAFIAKVETSYVSAWESLDAVNDGKLPSASNQKDVYAYGSWGNTSAYETITYKWPAKVSLNSTGLYLWTDGGGILWPTSYEFSYLDGSDWVTVDDAEGFGLEADILNETVFANRIETTAFEVKINKQAENGEGVGVFEWTALGEGVKNADEEEEEPTDLPEGENLAPKAEASGSHDKVDDGGGLAELNDEDDDLLTASSSTENGFWHNWEGFGEDAWVQYTWDKAVELTGMDVYYFATWDGFRTKEITLSYLNEDDEWIEITDAKGCGTELDQWNTTYFKDPIIAKAIKMVLTPLQNSVGILEWKVYGEEVEEVEQNRLLFMEEIIEEETEELTEEVTEEITEEETEELTEEDTDESAEEESESMSEKENEESKTEEDKSEEEETPVENKLSDEKMQESEEEVEEESTQVVSTAFVNKVTVMVMNLFRGAEPQQEVSLEQIQQTKETEESDEDEEKLESDVEEESETVDETENVVSTLKAAANSSKARTVAVQRTGIAETRLSAHVTDDGYPNMTLSYQWEVAEAPADATVTIAYPNKPISNATFDREGTYRLQLTVSDGELSGTDTVTIKVTKDSELPEVLAEYDFSEAYLDAATKTIQDVNHTGYDTKYAFNPALVFETVDGRDVITMDGGFCGYAKITTYLTTGKVSDEVVTESETEDGSGTGGNQQGGGSGNNNNNNNDSSSSSSGNSTSTQTAGNAVLPETTDVTPTVVLPDVPVAQAAEPTLQKPDTGANRKTTENVQEVAEAEIIGEKEEAKTETVKEKATSDVETPTENEVTQEEQQIDEEAVPEAGSIAENAAQTSLWWLWIVVGVVAVVAAGGITAVVIIRKKQEE